MNKAPNKIVTIKASIVSEKDPKQIPL